MTFYNTDVYNLDTFIDKSVIYFNENNKGFEYRHIDVPVKPSLTDY